MSLFLLLSGGAPAQVAPPDDGCRRLLEDGGSRLLEDGSYLLLETCVEETVAATLTGGNKIYRPHRQHPQRRQHDDEEALILILASQA